MTRIYLESPNSTRAAPRQQEPRRIIFSVPVPTCDTHLSRIAQQHTSCTQGFAQGHARALLRMQPRQPGITPRPQASKTRGSGKKKGRHVGSEGVVFAAVTVGQTHLKCRSLLSRTGKVIYSHLRSFYSH